MGHTLKYQPENKLVYITHEGRLNFKTVQQYSSEALKLARQKDCHKFLIDHSQTALQENIYKLHTEGEELEQFGFNSSDRIAVVIKQGKDNLNLTGSEKHYSHGSLLKYFDNVENAVAWLDSWE